MAALLAAAILPGKSEAKEELEDSDQDMDLVSLTNPLRQLDLRNMETKGKKVRNLHVSFFTFFFSYNIQRIVPQFFK